MLTFEDCVGLCELTEEEIAAIAEHEHLPQIVALELGSEMIRGRAGARVIRQIIVDDILAAKRRGNMIHACQLEQTLCRFIAGHPDARQSFEQ